MRMEKKRQTILKEEEENTIVKLNTAQKATNWTSLGVRTMS